MKEVRKYFLGMPLMVIMLAALVSACSSDDDDKSPAPETDKTPAGVVAVDLGLPSGTKWANMNVGASKVEDYGLFFAWGETTGYSSSSTSDGRSFDWANYKWMASGQSDWKYINKYTFADGQAEGSWYDSSGTFVGDGIKKLKSEDDAATANWSKKWRMPTHAECQELINNTDNEWTTINGVNGMKFMKKTDHTIYIFLPAAGCRYGSTLRNQGSYGYYWSSELYEDYSDSVWYLDFYSGDVSADNDCYRLFGQSVRAVCAQ